MCGPLRIVTPPAPLRGLCLSTIGLGALLAAVLLACSGFLGGRIPYGFAAAIHRSGAIALPLAGVLTLAGPLLATRLVARARVSSASVPHPVAAGDTARRSALLIVLPAGAAAAILALWAGHTALVTASAQPVPVALGIATLVLAFPLLIGERTLHAQDVGVLPEAPALRRLALGAVQATFATGLIAVAAALGAAFAPVLVRIVSIFIALMGAELVLRAVGRCFLPPGPPDAARAVSDSLLARLLTTATRCDGCEAGFGRQVLRDQLGIDISRSWALGYLRAAALPLTLVLLLCAWGLSGLAVVPVDGRAVYLRFGAPVAVLRPGLHAILPWPLGVTRAVEWGTVHELALGDTAPASVLASASPSSNAEDPAPVAADRLWDQPHPGEVTLLVASTAATGVAARTRTDAATVPDRQLFQSVSADMRVLYRVGLDDQSAILASTAVLDPTRLLRADADRIIATAFAASTLTAVLGADRERMAASLRSRLQRLLDAQQVGLEAVALVIEAIHPPAGAAEAYHAVRAAEITADASIYAERGRALTVMAQTRQYAFSQGAAATARAAETVGGARSTLTRFAADAEADHRNGSSFLFERRLSDLGAALTRTPMTIIDRRLAAPDATTLDLRPMPGAAPTIGDGE